MPKKTTKEIDNRTLSQAVKDPYVRFAAAMLAWAAKDAMRGDRSAAEWLLSDQALFYSECVGFSHRNIERWVKGREYAKQKIYY